MTDGVNEGRGINLPAQSANEDFDQLHVVLVFSLPHSLTQLRPAKDPARLAHQYPKQSELPCGKLDPARPAMQFVVAQVEDKVCHLQLDGRLSA